MKIEINHNGLMKISHFLIASIGNPYYNEQNFQVIDYF